MVFITLLIDACILPIVTSAAPSIVLIDHPVVFFIPFTVGLSLTPTAFVLNQIFVSILFMSSFIVETDVFGESVPHIFVLLITSELSAILALICLVIACTVAALVDALGTLLPLLTFWDFILITEVLVWTLAARRWRGAAAFLNTRISWDRYHFIWILMILMLLLTLATVFSAILFLYFVVNIVINLRDIKLVKITQNFKTKPYQFATLLCVTFKVARASTFDTPFLFA